MIQSHCTDERGGVQPTLAEFCKAWGVSPDYWLSDNYRNVGLHQQIHHFNPIFPWRVAREGNVRNALFS